MTTPESAELATALRERRSIVVDEASRLNPAVHMARLRAISEEIERLELSLPKPVPEQLAHFLQRRSYDKALSFLENEIELRT